MQPPSAVFAILVNEVVRERRAMSTEMAMRLERLFGTSVECWLNVQLHVVVHDALFVAPYVPSSTTRSPLAYVTTDTRSRSPNPSPNPSRSVPRSE